MNGWAEAKIISPVRTLSRPLALMEERIYRFDRLTTNAFCTGRYTRVTRQRALRGPPIAGIVSASRLRVGGRAVPGRPSANARRNKKPPWSPMPSRRVFRRRRRQRPSRGFPRDPHRGSFAAARAAALASAGRAHASMVAGRPAFFLVLRPGYRLFYKWSGNVASRRRSR